MAASADPLRSTLDTLELDPRSSADRPYLVAMLRRLGYTERDIEETLRTGKMPATQPTATDLAPARDYSLVVPARDSRFALDDVGRGGVDAPFEDLERVEFEDPSEDVAFEEVAEPGTDELAAEPTWEEAAEPARGDAPDGPSSPDELEEGVVADDSPEAGAEGEGDERLDTSPIHTFGDPDAAVTRNKTRVRVRRVRAGSKEEAERKVAGGGRTVIKSVPVDIVERWGANARPTDKPADEPSKGSKGG